MPESTSANGGSPQYITEVPYPRSFAHQLAPQTLRLVAALNGVAPPPDPSFDYCELGIGTGDTICTLAAANPNARFVGVDIGAEHLAFAKELAGRGGLNNLRLLERDFEALLREDLPDFDFIGAHGILTWVSEEKAKAIFAFARKKLKPGGLLYVSYNALPGWAALEPLRRLMLDHTASLGGSILDRAREGSAFAQRLADAGARYFTSHPTARSMLAVMREGGLPYVVHEYYNPSWRLFYFADVAREARSNDLSFVGQVPLYANIRDLAIPPSLKEMAKSVSDRVAFETLKDYAVNELFRSDVYMKGEVQPSEQVTTAHFEETPFGTMTTARHITREVKLPIYTLDYTGPVYDAILAAIAERAATARDLATRGKLAELGQARIGACLMNLALGGQVVPMRTSGFGGGPLGKQRLSPSYNEHALEQALSNNGPLVLASPTTGAGVNVSLLDAMCLHLLTQVRPAHRSSWIRTFAQRRSLPLVFGDRRVDSAEDLVHFVTRELDTFASSSVRKLLELGILTNAG